MTYPPDRSSDPVEYRIMESADDQVAFLMIVTPTAVLTLNPPRSWLARRFYRWLGFVWTDKP